VSLDDARERAAELTKAAKNGRDLLAERVAAKERADARMIVEELIELYARRNLRGRLRTAHEIEQRLRRALSSVIHLKADEIRRRDLRMIFDAVADRGALREAEKQRQSVGSMFRWAMGQDVVEKDITAGLTPYGAGQRRDRVLTDEEVRVLWRWFDESRLPADYVSALRLQLVLGARIGEVSAIRAEEIDQSTWLWALPAARSKNKRPRVTPLVGFARDIIAGPLRTVVSGPLFTTEKGLALNSGHVGAILVKHRRRVPIPHFVSHDLRRTVATGMIDLGVSFETVAAVLGHEVGGASVRILTRHYVRTDFVEHKRAALELWDRKMRRILEEARSTENVTELAKA
jgi:integrase